MKSFLPILFLLLSIGSFAGNEKHHPSKTNGRFVSGKVIDQQTGEVLAGAEVVIGDKKVYSDLDGTFSTWIESTPKEMLVNLVSYEPTHVQLPLITNDLLIELSSR